MFNIKRPTDKDLALKSLKGLFTRIPYSVRVPTGNWKDYFGKYQNQKWGYWDSSSCWCLSAVNCLEDQLEFLWKNLEFSDEAKKFFTENGYIDSDGDFSISERYLEILGGEKNTGGNTWEAWELMEKYGVIPRSLLNYTEERANRFYKTDDFVTDYFNTKEITQGMRDLGKESLKYLLIDDQTIGKNWVTPDIKLLQSALKLSPLQLGIPVPQPTNFWNQEIVPWFSGTNPDHAVELYGIADNGDYLIFDQYEPHLKVLKAGYYIPFVTQGVVFSKSKPVLTVPSPVEMIQTRTWSKVWTSVYNYFISLNLIKPNS